MDVDTFFFFFFNKFFKGMDKPQEQVTESG